MNFMDKPVSQSETTKIVDPFIAYMRKQGWTCYNIHGNKFQKGLPDYFCFREGRQIWIEFKVCDKSGYVEITQAQRVRFPEMIAGQLPVYIVGDYDLRNSISAIKEHYRRVTRGPSNLHLVLDKRLHKHIPSGLVAWKD